MKPSSALSEGQRQAIASLTAIAESSDGDLLLDAGYQRLVGRWLELRVWLPCRNIPVSQEGISLDAREPVDISVPWDFPFRPPQAAAGHTRFAGQTHVQWGNVLCLYASRGEWDPSAGMAGFLRRVLAFYQHLAAGTLSGPLAPWHPPVAYPDEKAGCVVVNADLTPVDRARPGSFLCWAIGVQMTADRIDIVDWLDLGVPGERPGQHQASHLAGELRKARARTGYRDAFLVPAVILPEPIAFEYPGFVGDLLNAVRSAGTGHQEVLDQLGRAMRVNRALRASLGRTRRDPILLLVRAPADKRFTSADAHAHFAAWRLEPDDEAVLSPGGDYDRYLERHVRWLKEARISWADVYDARAEAVVRRDTGRPMEKVNGSRVLILGCGALGAPIAEHCVRGGAASVDIVDWGVVHPGILVRQPYDDDDIGMLKAKVLAARLNDVRPGTDVRALVADVLSLPMDQKVLPHYDLIIDATADRSVAARLERWRCGRPYLWPDLVTVAISQTARRGIAAVTPRGSVGAGIDLLRRLALTACEDPALTDVYRDFFPSPGERIEFEPERGCSGSTFIGSTTDVTALAAQLLDNALASIRPGLVHVSAAGEADYVPCGRNMCIIRLGDDDGPEPARTSLVLTHDLIVADHQGMYEVRIDHRAMTQMQRFAREAEPADAVEAESETGGLLLGQFDDACRIAWVSEATGPPDGSFASPLGLAVNTPAAREDVRERSRQTGGLTSFVGLWHTHPAGSAWPSEIDIEAMNKLLVESPNHSPRLLLVVLGLPGTGSPAVGRWPEGWNPGIYAQVFAA
jgi:proteasome lid subunit RPN8/RPN11